MKIFKYNLVGMSKVIPMHGANPRILMVGLDTHGKACIWAEVDEAAQTHDVLVHIIGTGWDIPVASEYAGSYVQGPYVWHVYIERKAQP